MRLRHRTVCSEYCIVSHFREGTPDVDDILAGSHIARINCPPSPAIRHIPSANCDFPPCEGCLTLYASMPVYERAIAALLPRATTLRTSNILISSFRK